MCSNLKATEIGKAKKYKHCHKLIEKRDNNSIQQKKFDHIMKS